MSVESDLIWSLVSWAKTHGHNLGDCVSLVDSVMCRAEKITYAMDAEELLEARQDYDFMVNDVTHIYESVRV